MKRVRVGDVAPDLALQDQRGVAVSLADFRGKEIVILYFYPKDHTPVCTKEACGFRDAFHSFAEYGAVVIGVSADSSDSHRSFTEAHGLPFHLLADPDRSLRKAFGVPKLLGRWDGRVTYVIDKTGLVRHEIKSMLFASRHVSGALKAVRALAKE